MELFQFHNGKGEYAGINLIREGELSFEWRVRDAWTLPRFHKDYYWSRGFMFNNAAWWFYIWPNWNREALSPASGWMRLDVSRVDWGWRGPRKTYYVKVGIRGSAGVEKSREVEMESGGHRFTDFCSTSELMERKTSLMPDDVLTLTFVIQRTGAARPG